MARAIELEEAEVQEAFFERRWTDGLPIVPPTPVRVDAMLAAAGAAPDDIVGTVPERSRSVTAEKLAINAVMAGCAPAYFPVVITAMAAALDPAFNLNTVVTSTGGAGICVIVSGPVAASIGMNGRHNALGSGTRANATIGRAVRLVAVNVLGARTGEMDGSSIGHPGKYTLCLAEDPPPSPWEPLRVALGFDAGDTTVTVLPTEGPHQIANHLNGDPDGIVRTIAAAIRNPAQFAVGKGGQGLVVLGPEHAAAIIGGGWTRGDVQEALYRYSRIRPADLEAAGVLIERGAQHDMTPATDGTLPSMASPDDVFVVTAGGEGGGVVGVATVVGADHPLAGRDARGRGFVMTMITVLVPEYEDLDTTLSPRAKRGPLDSPAVLTLIDNGKPKAREVLRYIADELEAMVPIERVDIHTKPTAAAPIDADTARLLAARSRLVVTGLGD